MMTDWANYLDDLKNGKNTIQHPVLPQFRPVTLRHLAVHS